MTGRSVIRALGDLFVTGHRRSWDRPSWWSLWIVLPFVAISFHFCLRMRSDLEVARRQKSTIATITAHDPPNHDRYQYVFTVNGRSYSGWESPDEKRDFHIGEKLAVYYDPLDPSNSALMDFEELAIRAFAPVPMFLATAIAFAVLVIVMRHENTKSGQRTAKEGRSPAVRPK